MDAIWRRFHRQSQVFRKLRKLCKDAMRRRGLLEQTGAVGFKASIHNSYIGEGKRRKVHNDQRAGNNMKETAML
jgi:hypothetical protein